MQLTARNMAQTAGPINQLRSVTVTLDFNALITNLQAQRREAAEEQVAAACMALHKAGADFIVVTSGTTSTLTGKAKKRVSLPFLNLGDAAWAEVTASGAVGLLATSYAAKGGIFHPGAARRRFPLLVPADATAAKVDESIFGDLVCGRVTEQVMDVLGAALAELVGAGAKAIILGNTDMTQAADALQQRCTVPLIDSAMAHARAAARRALSGQ